MTGKMAKNALPEMIGRHSGDKKGLFPEFVPPKTLVQEIKEYLSRLIILERLPTGERLVPETIANQLSVSKQPVREALVMLVQEELLVSKPRMGFFVAEISLRDINEIYPIRAMLNGLLITSIIEEGYESDFIPALEEILEKMRKAASAENNEDFFKYNVQFYDFMHDRCPNMHLSNIILQLGMKVLRFRYIVHTQKGHPSKSYALHEQLVKAMKEGDAAEAASIGRTIVLTGLSVLRTHFATLESS